MQAEEQNTPWHIVNQKEKLDSNTNKPLIKTQKLFINAKGSILLWHKTTTLVSTKHKADNQVESHAIKKIKLDNLSNNTMK